MSRKIELLVRVRNLISHIRTPKHKPPENYGREGSNTRCRWRGNFCVKPDMCGSLLVLCRWTNMIDSQLGMPHNHTRRATVGMLGSQTVGGGISCSALTSLEPEDHQWCGLRSSIRLPPADGHGFWTAYRQPSESPGN